MRLLLTALAAVAVFAGCGSGATHAPATTAPTPSAAPPSTTGTTSTGGGPGALQAEANATAAGDIPDNQVFLTFHDAAAGYSMKYPEGWAQQGSGARVTFRDKNNIVRVVVGAGPKPTAASVDADLASLQGAQVQTGPQAIPISGEPAFRAVYATESAANSVTGKRVRLVVDRYYLWHAGKRAVVDLGTPQGVDNVDAYRLMVESFGWS